MLTPRQLFDQYQPVAKKIAGGFARKIPNRLRDDVFAAAMGGLWDAASRSEDSETFERYARTRIRGAIQDELRRQDWLPRRAREQNPELSVCSLEGFERPDEIRAMSVEPDAEDALERQERALALKQKLAELPEREAWVLGETLAGRPLWELARELGLSEARLSQLRSRAELRITGKIPLVSKPGPRPRAQAQPEKRPRRALETRPPAPSPPRPAPVIPKAQLPRLSLWTALVEGTWQYCGTIATDGGFELRLRLATAPRPIPLLARSVLQHWLSFGKPRETASQFGICRSHVGGLCADALQAMGFTGTAARVPAVIAVAASAARTGDEGPVVLTGADGFASARIEHRSDWLARLSPAGKDTVAGLLGGETREAIAARRGTSTRTIANQLRTAFSTLNVSTISELRALYARQHVAQKRAAARAA